MKRTEMPFVKISSDGNVLYPFFFINTFIGIPMTINIEIKICGFSISVSLPFTTVGYQAMLCYLTQHRNVNRTLSKRRRTYDNEYFSPLLKIT